MKKITTTWLCLFLICLGLQALKAQNIYNYAGATDYHTLQNSLPIPHFEKKWQTELGFGSGKMSDCWGESKEGYMRIAFSKHFALSGSRTGLFSQNRFSFIDAPNKIDVHYGEGAIIYWLASKNQSSALMLGYGRGFFEGIFSGGSVELWHRRFFVQGAHSVKISKVSFGGALRGSRLQFPKGVAVLSLPSNEYWFLQSLQNNKTIPWLDIEAAAQIGLVLGPVTLNLNGSRNFSRFNPGGKLGHEHLAFQCLVDFQKMMPIFKNF